MTTDLKGRLYRALEQSLVVLVAFGPTLLASLHPARSVPHSGALILSVFSGLQHELSSLAVLAYVL